MKQLYEYAKANSVFLSWTLGLLAIVGSLTLSEIVGLVPCKLCWYQRILLVLAVAVIGIAEHRKYKYVYRFVLPLTVGGGLVALYHTLLQWGVVPEGSLTCSINSSCALKQINLFGFITIPFMSLVVFSAMTLMMVWARRQTALQHQEDN